MKTGKYWHKNRYVEEQNKKQITEINPYIHIQWIFDKLTEINPGRKDNLQHVVLEKMDLYVQKVETKPLA